MTKLTALGGSRCAEMIVVTDAGIPVLVAAHAQGVVQQINASEARFNNFTDMPSNA
jgi:hypothetical protein